MHTGRDGRDGPTEGSTRGPRGPKKEEKKVGRVLAFNLAAYNSDDNCHQIQLSVPKLSASSQLELLYHEILYLREGVVDVLAFFLLILNKGDEAPFISLP